MNQMCIRDRANTKISADQVEELLLKGKSHGGVLTYREIMDSMQNVEDMTPDDMDSMYELIAQKGIDVVDENSDDDVLPVNDDDTEEINEAELANLSVPEGVSIDAVSYTHLKLIVVKQEDSVASAARKIIDNEIDCLPVIRCVGEDKRSYEVVGRITKTNFTRLLVDLAEGKGGNYHS